MTGLTACKLRLDLAIPPRMSMDEFWHSMLVFMSRAHHLHDLQIYRMPPPAPQTVIRTSSSSYTCPCYHGINREFRYMSSINARGSYSNIANTHYIATSLATGLQVFCICICYANQLLEEAKYEHCNRKHERRCFAFAGNLCSSRSHFSANKLKPGSTTYTYDSRSKETWS